MTSVAGGPADIARKRLSPVGSARLPFDSFALGSDWVQRVRLPCHGVLVGARFLQIEHRISTVRAGTYKRAHTATMGAKNSIGFLMGVTAKGESDTLSRPLREAVHLSNTLSRILPVVRR